MESEGSFEWEMDRDLERTGAHLTGHFRLRSGRCSAHFYQFARLGLMDAPRLRYWSAVLGERLQNHRVDAVVGVAKGGIVPGHEAAVRIAEMQACLRVGERPPQPLSAYAEKARYDAEKGVWVADESSEELRLLRGFAQAVRGKRVAIVEDAVTTGGSAGRLARHIREVGGTVAVVGMLLQRGEIRDEALATVPIIAVVRKHVDDHEPDACPQRAADGTHLPYTPIPGKG